VLIKSAATGEPCTVADVELMNKLAAEFNLTAESISADIAAVNLHADCVEQLKGLPEAKAKLADVEQQYETIHRELEAAKSKCLPRLEDLQQQINTANARVENLDRLIDVRRHDIETRLPHLFASDPPVPPLQGPQYSVSDVIRSRPSLPPTAIESPDFNVRWSANLRRTRAAQLYRDGFVVDEVDAMLAAEQALGMFDVQRWAKWIAANVNDVENLGVGQLPQ
jgi:uncharacterized protein YhaN